jgi:CheY-like chemotaxis protein
MQAWRMQAKRMQPTAWADDPRQGALASMLYPTLPAEEPARLATLRALDVLDTPPDRVLDELAHVASRVCGTPIALVSLVDEARQWFKARVGLAATETCRDVAFCAHAIHGRELFEIADSHRDARFADNPLVAGPPHVRFYAGVPLVVDDVALGTLCVIDVVPRALTADQRDALRALARSVASHLQMRRTERELIAARAQAERLALARTRREAASRTASPCDVLLVEGEPVNRLIAERVLRRAGHRVAVAVDGADALERTRERRFDLILMGCTMPGLDGLRATRALRDGDGPNSDTPIVALTAGVLAEEHTACRHAGMDDVLIEPIRPDVLEATIVRHVSAPRRRAPG